MRPIGTRAGRRTALGMLGIATTTLAVLPAAAQSDDAAGASAPAQTTATPTAQAAAAPQRATLHIGHTRRNVLVGRRVLVRGHLTAPAGAHTVALQTRSGHHWATVDRARTRAGGSFTLHYTARQLGSRSLRVAFGGDRTATATRRTLGRLNVYRRVFVSWYQLNGSPLACGGRLSPGRLGVANKTLPCGTKVTLRYKGHTVRVPVIDRGPYVGGREYDLTGATKRALHMGDLATIEATR